MVRIRLRRMGAKRQPYYRVVVADSESPRDGRFLEIIGSYNPRVDPPAIDIKADRVAHWLSVGAKPSDSVVKLLTKVGIPASAKAAAAAVETAPVPETETQPAAPEA